MKIKYILLLLLPLLTGISGCKKINCLSGGCVSQNPEVDANKIMIKINMDSTGNGFTQQQLLDLKVIIDQQDTLQLYYWEYHLEYGYKVYKDKSKSRTLVFLDPATGKETVIDDIQYYTYKDDCCKTNYKIMMLRVNGVPQFPDQPVVINRS